MHCNGNKQTTRFFQIILGLIKDRC